MYMYFKYAVLLLYITDADAIDVYNHLAGEAFIQLGGGH